MPDFRGALNAAMVGEMERDERVVLIGEDVAIAGGVFKVTEGLRDRFGSERVLDTPISELALAGAAFGGAAAGLRPIVEVMFGDFMPLVMDSLINQAAKYWFISEERHSIPLVFRSAVGAGGRFGPIHSQNPGTLLHNVPGIKVICPATPAAAESLLRAAIRDPNPVVFLEHKRLYTLKEDYEPAAGAEPGRLGEAIVRREGDDVTLVSIMKGVHDALEAADRLAEQGVSAEVVDLQSLRPLDVDTVAASLAKTNRLVAIEEGPRTGGWAMGLLGALAATSLDNIEDVWTLNTIDGPVPFSPTLEDADLPGPDRIVEAVAERVAA